MQQAPATALKVEFSKHNKASLLLEDGPTKINFIKLIELSDLSFGLVTAFHNQVSF